MIGKLLAGGLGGLAALFLAAGMIHSTLNHGLSIGEAWALANFPLPLGWIATAILLVAIAAILLDAPDE